VGLVGDPGDDAFGCRGSEDGDKQGIRLRLWMPVAMTKVPLGFRWKNG
jgi:hypothetical protein